MRARELPLLKMLLLVAAALVAMGAWGLYMGEPALAQGPPFFQLPHFKCYETSGTPLNLSLRLFDQFHPPQPGGTEIPAGGEDVTVKGPQHFCTPLFAKCFAEEKRCEFFEFPPEGRNHLKCYKITPSGPPVNQSVLVEDQFDRENLRVGPAQFLCAPACKEEGCLPE